MEFSQQNMSRICEVLSMNGEIVATGRISEISNKHITIKNSVGKMPILNVNKLVKFLVHNDRSDDETFAALIKKSTTNELVLGNIELITNLEKREYFRVSVKINTKCYVDEGTSELDESKSFKVKIRDLSLRGTFVITNKKLKENQKIYLVIPFKEPQIFKCIVKREVKRSKSIGYGCEFVKYTTQQEDLLCQYIFEQQRKMILKAKSFD